ncbi:hypothetical protein F4818DRAFT_359959 [Hypoxylon cercidicola]|nr:hypothetical protein F4818DRAFT_359959 [Hypoxylon cercidicola]
MDEDDFFPPRPRRALLRGLSSVTHPDDCDRECLPQYLPTSPRPHRQQESGRFPNIVELFALHISPLLLSRNLRYTLQTTGTPDLPPPSRNDKVPQKEVRRKSEGIPLKETERQEPMRPRLKNEILEYLQPMLASDGRQACNILVCWGKDTRCDIFPVRVSPEADDTENWRAINEAWYQRRGSWRKYIPMFGVRAVEKVKISILSQLHDPRSQKHEIRFRGRYRCLANEMKEAEEQLNSINTDGCFCYVNGGAVRHGFECRARWECYLEDIQLDFEDIRPPSCPANDFYEAKMELSRLELRSFFLSAFLDTNATTVNHLLSYEDLIISERDVLEEIGRNQNAVLCQLEFNGVLVREGWEFDSQHITVPFAVTFLFAVIIGSRFVYGDWSTAWTFGGFLVSFITLLWTWAHHALS